MTVVVGTDYLDEILVIADTRVSCGDTYETNRGLKKLLVFGNKDKVTVLGFTCLDVRAAKAVTRYLMEEKLTTGYKRRFVIAHLKEDIRKWIQQVTARLPSSQVAGLSFILCALEPSRKRPLRRNGLVTSSPFPERHMCIYRVVKGGKEVEMHERGPVAVIGPDEKLETRVVASATDLISFGRGMPNFHIARSVVVGHVISSIFRDMDSKKVGGPFQVVRIVPPPDPSQLIYLWSREDPKVEVTNQGDRTVMNNLLTGESCVLLPIWEWG